MTICKIDYIIHLTLRNHMFTEIKIGPELVIQFEEPLSGEGIGIAGNILSVPAIPNINRKIYFSVGGPKIWGYPGIENYPSDLDNIVKPDNHVSWKLAQHDRRYWQAGQQVVAGVDHPDYNYKIELTEEQSKAISQYFL